jgi:hypothetical protein
LSLSSIGSPPNNLIYQYCFYKNKTALFFIPILKEKTKGMKSDTPCKAGGLMSGAASKAVDPLAKRRAKARLSYQV